MKIKIKSMAFTIVATLTLGASLLTGCSVVSGRTTGPAVTNVPTVTVTVTASPAPASVLPTETLAQAALALPSITDVVALVKPSVVSINVEVPVTSFFGQSIQEGSGSGWILDAIGLIVTNYHVVEGASTITVSLDDDRSFTVDPGKVYTDPTTDLAVLDIDAEGLPALTIGDSDALRVGDWVVAIGNSLGRGTRATVGIVSQLGVTIDIEDQSLYNLIDTSAVINPGNSGGPLVNLAGEVIGITSAKIVQTGAEATGFAIPSRDAAPIIQDLVNNGYVSRPFLGVQGLLTMDSAVASYYRLTRDEGVLIRGILEGGPALQAGLQAGDIIVSIGGQDIATLRELTGVLYRAEIGQPLEVRYWRDDHFATAIIYPVETPR